MRLAIAIIFCTLIGFASNAQQEQDTKPDSIDILLQQSQLLENIDYLKARRMAERAAFLSEQQNDSSRWSKCLRQAAYICDIHADYENEIIFSYKAVEIDKAFRDTFHFADGLTHIGNAYLNLDRNDEASIVFEEAFDLYLLSKDTFGIQMGLLNLGVVSQRDGNYPEALKAFRNLYSWSIKSNSKLDQAIALGNTGATFNQMQNCDSALYYLSRAFVLKKGLNNGRSAAHTLNDLSLTSFNCGDPSTAEQYALQAITYADTANASKQLMTAYDHLVEIYSTQGLYEKAFNSFKIAEALQDSLFTLEQQRSINELNIRYNTAIKDNEITQLELSRRAANTRSLIGGILAFTIIAAIVTFILLRIREHKRDKLVLAKLTEVDVLRTEFFANVSHELRTPMTLIQGPLQKINEGKLNEESTQQLSIARRNSLRLQKLIDQLLDISRMDRQDLVLNIAPAEIDALVRSAYDSFTTIADNRNIRFEIDATETDKSFYVDVVRLESVILNLLSNAFKFTPEGGRIQIVGRPAASGYEITIEDNGRGIQPNEIDKVFDRYYSDNAQAHLGSTGFGIGLSLCKTIVDRHGGTIMVESHPGRNTKFIVSIPSGRAHFESREDVQFVAADENPWSASALAVHDVSVKPDGSEEELPLVLVVEDNDDMRNYIRSILAESYRVQTASEAKSGLAIATESIPDLIVSDVMMPGMSGMEFCKKIKTNVATCHIPVILLTAKSSDKDRLHGLEQEADVYMTKPFIAKELMLNLRNLMRTRERVRARYDSKEDLIPVKVASNKGDQQFLEAILEQCKSHYQNSDLSIEEFARSMFMSRSQLHRKVKALTGQSISQFIRSFRLRKARQLLSEGNSTILSIALEVGFSSASYFSTCFVEEYGVTPGSLASENI